MSVYTYDSDGKLHKKCYFKDGYPQKVFKDGELIFPDFVMINSGGHGTTGDMPCKTTIYGGNLGFNNLFQPYSSKDFNVGGQQTGIVRTQYYTDSVVYGKGCVLTDTFNLGDTQIHNRGDVFPLSSCGDAVKMDIKTLRGYLNQLDDSSTLFLYCKISADSDSIERYIQEHNINRDSVNFDESYNPKIKFGVGYSFPFEENVTGEDGSVTKEYGIHDTIKNYNGGGVKHYKSLNGCSNAIDIECLLNDDNIYYGVTNNYLNPYTVYTYPPGTYGDGISSSFVKYSLNNYDSHANYDGRVFITPNFEYHKGLIKLRNGTSANLYINKACSGEWGVSYDKSEPHKMTLCENFSSNIVYYGDYDRFNVEYDIVNNDKGTQYTYYYDRYPFSNDFYSKFLKYTFDNGYTKSSWAIGENVNDNVYAIVPDYVDYKNGLTDGHYGFPFFLETTGVDPNPKSIKYINNGGTNGILEKCSYSSLGGMILTGLSYVYLGMNNRQGKMLIQTEFDARTKFSFDGEKEFPICLLTFDYQLSSNAGGCYYHKYVGANSIISSHNDLKNLYAENWNINDEWKHYGFTAEINWVNMQSGDGVINSKSYNLGQPLIPYFSIWGDMIVSNPTKFTCPYEVKNVTTTIYI